MILRKVIRLGVSIIYICSRLLNCIRGRYASPCLNTLICLEKYISSWVYLFLILSRSCQGNFNKVINLDTILRQFRGIKLSAGQQTDKDAVNYGLPGTAGYGGICIFWQHYKGLSLLDTDWLKKIPIHLRYMSGMRSVREAPGHSECFVK